ncbi:MerR family transcriptional regulator [Acanthopleuribacter pedis]|uniref:MerR family transcriptional regulator n=1 Tax=Acanthopleuribacter pedis TaxID=442870 RepID=A0A8J7QIK3_9BACT|nr:MerR family transcriptional regulator [Acanthopleuribacter pedis]MBO1321401.1 MerR family transcriptional regulator [Acanthopleuribacter pedis]
MALETKKGRTIGAAAKAAGLGVETIRFYERKGLIVQPPKHGGFRTYSDNDIKQLRFIRKAKTLGFTLDAIKSLLALESGTEESNAVIHAKSEETIREIQQKIAELEQMLASLQKFSTSCAHGKKTSAKHCGLLECFEKDWDCC